MASFTRVTETGIVSLYYEVTGQGFPVLLLAPGGMKSTLTNWVWSPWDPVSQLAEHFTVIAMDQRNAGRSTGPITSADNWNTYTEDQIALMNHLGFGKFHMVGMCIGGSHIGNLLATSPDRVAAAVAMQPIGIDNNQEEFFELFDEWADGLKPHRPDVTEQAWIDFRTTMFGSNKIFFSNDETTFQRTKCPMLVLMGTDLFHPESSSRAMADAASARLIESWKDEPDAEAAKAEMTQFLLDAIPES